MWWKKFSMLIFSVPVIQSAMSSNTLFPIGTLNSNPTSQKLFQLFPPFLNILIEGETAIISYLCIWSICFPWVSLKTLFSVFLGWNITISHSQKHSLRDDDFWALRQLHHFLSAKSWVNLCLHYHLLHSYMVLSTTTKVISIFSPYYSQVNVL